MKISFKALVKFALLLCQIRCLISNTDAFCFEKCHLIAIYICVVQWFMFVYFILFLGMKGSVEMTVLCWMTRKT
jgi:hypothetical protein